MRHSYLEVTYRRGRPMAAYLYLPRTEEDVSAKTRKVGEGLLVDFNNDGRPIGVEITSPRSINISALNTVLTEFGIAPVDQSELAPLSAA